MATLMVSKVFVIFLVFLPLVFVNSEARLLLPKSTPMMGKRINTELLLRDLVKNSKVREHQQKRSMLGAKLERLSPAGPDPQHH
ncbi:CLAVATA3/ESR (CLE)-related protein 53-like [Vigna umbellata]|uniref:CLAVATA3/ESR (CLE)-related protein 53-like n=1 Tax=Vigna umbellata TaxID=87088 RepID=UPI001F5EFC02|nr:CLAVATA3/ESR (CLE)-related protein 53-like [Vigna umbellata]